MVRDTGKDRSLHDTKWIKPVDEKYHIKEAIPLKPEKHKLLPSCSNAYLFQLTRTWDKGSRQVRERILKEFVGSMQNATGPQLEKELNNGASLFLTRISAWLRLTYLLGYDLSLQLSAIIIFISAASGTRFLTEFIEVGGLLTVLEILTISQAREQDRSEALHLLIKVASNGRKYKEFICESYGVRQVTECLSKSKSEITQDYARNLLVSLGTGNPKFQLQVFKGLQSLLSSPAVAPSAQQMSAQALRALLAITPNAPTSIIEPAASLLRSQHMQVQYEGYELLRELVYRPNCQDTIISMLVSVLKNIFEPSNIDEGHRNGKDAKQWTIASTEDQKEKERLMAGYVQQAYASKLVGVLIASSVEITEKLIKCQVVSALLNVIANVGHPESQRYATSNLIHLFHNYDYVAASIKDNMGENFCDLLENKPDTFYRELTKEQVRYLRRNTIKIKKFDSQDKDESDEDSDSDEEGQKSKRHVVSFPGAYPKEENEKETVPEEKPTQTEVPEQESKLQQQIILDTYEKSESESAKQMVEDVYSQFQNQTTTHPTFPGNKFSTSTANTERIQFENELEEFRYSILIVGLTISSEKTTRSLSSHLCPNKWDNISNPCEKITNCSLMKEWFKVSSSDARY
jgi:hypothetical protein